jgi:hypothetical protein
MDYSAKKLIRISLIKLVFVSMLLMQIACTKTNSPHANTIFNFDSLLKNQINILHAGKAQLSKTATINDSTEHQVTTPKDSTAWAGELEIFEQMGVFNSPTIRQNYFVQEADDTQSNLRVKIIQTDKNLPLKRVKIYFLENEKNIRRIEGELSEKNILYQSTRALSMNFAEVHNQLMLTTYTITAGQHMIVGDTLAFLVNATITLPE